MLKTINSDGSLKISLIGSAVPAGAVYNDGLAYAPDGSLYVKLTQGALSGQVYNGGLACTPDGALYVANSTPVASATFRRGLLCRADGAVHVSDATVVTVRHDGGIPKDNAGRLFVGIPLAGLALATDAATGVTSSGGFASAWADQSGNGRNLLQATGANQPIHLAYSGTKYWWTAAVAGNTLTGTSAGFTPQAGKTTFVADWSLDDWTPASENALLSQWQGSGVQGCFDLAITPAGRIVLYACLDGATLLTPAVSSAPGFVDGTRYKVAAVHDSATGGISYYSSADSGASWTPLGTGSVTAGTLFNSSSTLEIGSVFSGGATRASGKAYGAQIYYGDAITDFANATLAANCDPSRWTSGTTFSATTGETYTLAATGSKPAQIVDRASLLFDGAMHFMQCTNFTLNQPETVYLVAKQVTWTSNDYLFDGGTAVSGSMALVQDDLGVSPNLLIYAGTRLRPLSGPAVGVTGVVASVFNGASSSIQINGGSITSGTANTANAGGFTLARPGASALSYSNIQAYEVLIYNVAHDAATRANVIRVLMSKHGVA